MASKHHPLKYLHKEKRSDFIVEKLGWEHPNQVMEMNTSRDRVSEIHVRPRGCSKDQASLLGHPFQMHTPNSMAPLGDILHRNWSVIPKSRSQKSRRNQGLFQEGGR